MLKRIRSDFVGPVAALDVSFAPRLNVVTGDNGLGKSFLLDMAWWSLTRRWPRDVNPAVGSGFVVRPHKNKAAQAYIEFTVSGKSKEVSHRSTFSLESQAWIGKIGRPAQSGLVVYIMADGSFAVWDPARNYWQSKENVDQQERIPAYVFTNQEIWDGLRHPTRGVLCNGLIHDWAGWQKENGLGRQMMEKILLTLSASANEPLRMGDLVRMSLDDVRDIPTLRMPYGQDVPVLHVSSGTKRIIALAYLLVWAWLEHQKASQLLEQEPTDQIVLLLDEVEAHLHPSWQRSVVRSLLQTSQNLAGVAAVAMPSAAMSSAAMPGVTTDPLHVQILMATHAPLVMASIEPFFDPSQDAWFDLDLEKLDMDTTNQKHAPERAVRLVQQRFVRWGEASRWMLSEAFDLSSTRSIEAEEVLGQAQRVLSQEPIDIAQAQAIDQKLRGVLGDTDPFWIRWRFVGEKQGWL